MKHLGGLLGVLAAVWSGAALAQTSTSNDARVQVPELAEPQRASLAGQLAAFTLAPADVSRGAFTLPSVMAAPAERGAIQAGIFPSYSAENGISEWGMGWQVSLAMTRARISGDITYADDELTGPFGRLVRGEDGDWYPVGLAQKVRVAWDEALDVLTAYLPDGTVMTFGSSTRVVVAGKGTFSWQLDEVRSVTNRKTHLTWSSNASGRPFLTSVSYGGVGDAFQARVDLAYQALPVPFEDYRSSTRLTLDQRVSTVTVRARHAVTGAFEERWHWDLGYLDDGYGPGFYLVSVQQVFRSGDRPPPVTYSYNLANDRLGKAVLVANDRINPLLAVRSDLLQPGRSATLDEEQDGRTDVEWGYDGRLFRQTETGFVGEPLPPAPPGYSISCRRAPSQVNTPRTLARLRSGVGDETLYVLDARASAGGTTTYFTACERSGLPYTISATSPWTVAVAGSWVPGPTVRLVDLDRDHRPDLIRLQAGMYRAVRNVSTGGAKAAAAFAFGPEKSGTLSPSFTADTAWVQDMNGDGIPDLIGRYSSGIVVWAGKGNLDFDGLGRVMQLRVNGSPLTRLTDYAITFVDANKDGLTDVLLSKTVGNSAYLFLNQGTGFDWVDLPGLRSVTGSYAPPIAADFSGSGNTELAYSTPGQGWSFALDGPETGLMATADDGRGTILAFDYTRARAAPGARGRPSVLARLTVHSSGSDSISASYDYASPAIHAVGKFLLGYDQVQRSDPLSTAWTSFLNDEVSSGLMLESTTLDALVPGIEQFGTSTYETATFQGLSWRRLVAQESGWRNIDGSGSPVSTVTSLLAWSRGVCAERTERKTLDGTLDTLRTFASPDAFSRSLACLVSRTVEVGTHADPSLDFRLETLVSLNEVGQPTGIASVDAGVTWWLQSVVYDGAYRPVTLSAPGRGAFTIIYDPATGLLTEVTRPDGASLSATSRDPLTSALRGLRSGHGRLGFDKAFTFDGQERLIATTDSLGGSESLDYRYPTLEAPGAVSVETLVESISGASVVRRARDLVTASGEAVAHATAIPEGWAFGKLSRRNRSSGEVIGLLRDATGTGADPATLDYATLYAGADLVDRSVSGIFGVSPEASTAFHAGVVRQTVGSLSLVDGRVIRNQRENGLYDTTSASDAGGQVAVRWDELGTGWSYTHDAAGRLRDVLLPDGAHHRAGYDGHGRVISIARDGVATVEYDYDPTSGLPIQKRFRSPAGALVRKVDFTHDAIGRLVEAHHQDATTSASQIFHHYYDGATPDAPSVDDTPGFLTAVAGDDFEKRFEYREDGRVSKQVLSLRNWRRVESVPEYDLAGGARGETISVFQPGVAAPLLVTTRHDTYDAVGRSLETWVDGAFLSLSSYDSQGRLGSVSFANGDGLALTYDPLTRRLTGADQSTAGLYASVSERLNDRGLVQAEQFQIGGLAVTRQFGYSSQRFLTSSVDALRTWGYAFDPSGLPTRITEDGAVTDLVRSGNTLTAGQLVSTLDGLGRTVSRGDLSLEYGPNGQVATARRGTQEWTFVYDENGRRLAKAAGGVPVAAYTDAGFLDERELVSPVKVAGRTVGVLRNGRFETISTDLRGTVIADPDGTPRLASPFGRRDVHPVLAAAIDYVERGYDGDLGLVRMGVRDYDPQLNRFTTPDPLVLDRPEVATSRPLEFALYSYADNAPLDNTDPSGLYPTKGRLSQALGADFSHDLAIDRMLSASHSAEVIAAMQKAQIDIDKDQKPEEQYKHAMFDDRAKVKLDNGKERPATRDEFIAKANAYVKNELMAARQSFAKGDGVGGGSHQGSGTHVLQDGVSNPHEGFQNWNKQGLTDHFDREKYLPGEGTREHAWLMAVTGYANDIVQGKAPMPDNFFDPGTGKVNLPEPYQPMGPFQQPSQGQASEPEVAVPFWP
jgi:RHS repeat-associated protein